MDLLSGLPARPSTPVPGHWLLGAPPIIHISIFAADAATESADDTTAEDIVTGLRKDPIEQAWMDINGSGETRDALTKCAVVVPGKKADPPKPDEADKKDAPSDDAMAVDGPAENNTDDERPKEIDLTAEGKEEPKDEAQGRRLWVFSAEAIETPEGLTLAEQPAPIVLSSTLTCTLHGQNLACLAAGNDCTPVFQPPPAWRYLEAAAGEKLAWKRGQRLSLLPNPLRIDRTPPLTVRIRPTSNDQLLLIARPRAIPHCAPQPGLLTSPAGRNPLVLRPLALPALLVAPVSVSSAQDARLSAAFDVMGADWKNGRAEARVAAQAMGERPADWSVYFVPLRTNRVAKMLPTTVAAQWRGTPGVLTVWPTHLARPLAPVHKSAVQKPPKPGPGLGEPPALLDAATGLFDFFTSYIEPASDGVDEDADADETMEEVQPIEIEVEVEADDAGDEESRRETGSDVDDLFSASPSPEPEPEQPDEEPFIASAFTSPRGLELEVDDLFGNDEPVEPETAQQEQVPKQEPEEKLAEHESEPVPEPEIPEAEPPSRADTDMNDKNDVTEDDFNFFDSPAKQTEPTPAPAPIPEPAPEPVLSAVAEETPKPEDGATEVPAPEPITELTFADLPVLDVAQPEARAETEALPEQDPPQASETQLQVVRSPRKRTSVDVVPPAFAPLQLPKRPRMRFAYGLPSPISPASSTLRVELVERLREKSGQDKKYDYAQAWELSSESSDEELDSAFTTGAPPTPSSSDDEDGTPAPRQASAAPPPALDHEVSFDGTVCVGGEWVSLKDNPGLCSRLARAWAPAWVELPPEPPEYIPLSPEADGVPAAPTPDLEAVVNAAVRHRFLRPLFMHPVSDDTLMPAPLVKLGVPLAELTEAGQPAAATYALSPANVNVGLGGNILQLSAAGLRYWRELGLQPAGGQKNVTAYVVCEPGESERLAAGFLRDIGEVYASHLLGKHEPGTAEGTDGVIAVPPSDVPGVLSRLGGAVVYVLTYAARGVNVLSMLRQNVHVVPVEAVRVGNLLPLAFEVYDGRAERVPRVQLRGRQLASTAPLPFHAFTLALPAQKPQLTMSWPQASYDVLARQRHVHCAYAFAGAHVVLAVVDGEGDALDLRVLPFTGVAEALPRMWDVFVSLAEARSRQYALTITRAGLMSKAEIGGWKTLFPAAAGPVTLLMAEPPAPAPARPRTPVANVPPSTFADPSAAIVDETLAGAAAPLSARIAIELPPAPTPAPTPAPAPVLASAPGAPGEAYYPPASFVLSMANAAGTGASTATFHVLFASAGTPGAAHDALAPRFYELACLGRRRYALGALPVHIDAALTGAQAVEVVSA